MTAPHKQLRDLAIFEISLVDKPAQQPAVIACVKRAPVAKSEPAPPADPITEDKSMDSTEMAAHIVALEAELAALKDKLAALEALAAPTDDAEKSTDEDEIAALAELPEDEMKHAASLAKAERRAFIAKAAPDRAAIVAPIYKAADGTRFYKGEEKIAAFAKRADDADAKAATVALTKRAEAELAHLPGTLDEKVATLKAIDALPAEAKAVVGKALVAVDQRNAPLFKSIGTAEGKKVDEVDASPLAALDGLAKAHAKAERTSYAKAYAAVLDSAEGKRLYGEFTKSAAV